MSEHADTRYGVHWTRGDSISVTTAEELDAILQPLHTDVSRADALVVAITSPAGDDLTLGIGRDTTVVGWTSADGDPPHFVSRGSTEEGDDLVFFYDGHWTDFPASRGIPVEDAFEAARLFVRTGERPTNIRWDEV
jgi:hypothetical protein